jgi:hypothetical protein
MTRLVKKDHPIATPPPPFVERAIFSRKVQKGGGISIRQLRQGTKVNLVQVDELTFLVSGRPPSEVQELVDRLPAAAASPYAALSAATRGVPNLGTNQRVRANLSEEVTVKPIDEEAPQRGANLQRTTRSR